MRELRELLRSQDGVVSRGQLIALGVTDAFIRHQLTTMRWLAFAPGVYLTTGGAMSTDTQRARGAVLCCGAGSMITGTAGLRLHGVNAAVDPQIHALIAHSSRRVGNRLVRPIRSRALPRPVAVRGIPVAPIARCAIDACRGVSSLDEVRARLAAPVQQRRCEAVSLLAAAFEVGRIGPVISAGLTEIVDGVRSAPEGRVRKLVLASELPAPLWNPSLYSSAGLLIAIPDAYWEDAGVAIEVESRQYHFSPASWERTLARRALMSSYGILVVQCPPSRLRQDSKGFIQEVIRAHAMGLARDRLAITVRPAR